MITYGRVHELFDYNGMDLVWKKSTCGAKNGTIAGCLLRSGYRQIGVDWKRYYAHRLIWMYYYGYFPENDIDHINRCKTDNRIGNLREISHSCNIRNCGNLKNNISGVKGVRLNKSSGKWKAAITVSTKNHHLCTSKDFDEAVLHRLAAEQCLDLDKCDSKTPAYSYAVKNKLIRVLKL